MRQKLLLVCVLAVSTVFQAQKASIKSEELAGEKVIVWNDLEDSNPANKYHIQFYSSKSDFNTALAKVTGDAGNEIKPGHDKSTVTQQIKNSNGEKAVLRTRGLETVILQTFEALNDFESIFLH